MKKYILILLISVLCCKKKSNEVIAGSGSNDSLKTTNREASLLAKLPNDSLNRARLFMVLLNYYKAKDWPSFQLSSGLLLRKSIAKQDTVNIANVYRYKGGYYKGNGVYDSAFYFYLKAEKLFKKIKDNKNLSIILLNKSIVQYYASDYFGADRSITEAYSFFKNLQDPQKLYEVFTMMGIISNELKDYDKAVEYYDKALNIVRENNIDNIEHQKSTCLNNLGYNYQNLKKYDEAIKNYKIALEDKNLETETPDLYSLLLDNLAYCKFKLHDNSDLPTLFYQSLKVREKIQATTLIILSKIHLSEYFEDQNKSLQSQKLATAALMLAKTSRNPRDILASLKQCSNVDHENASQYSKDYIRISDSIQEIERNSQQKFARLQLETDDIIQEKDKLAEQNRNLLYYFFGILFLGLLLFIIRIQRARNRELLLKQAQQKANEDIYNLMINQQSTIEENRIQEKKRIAQELHDGVLGRLFGARLNLDSLNKFTDEKSINSRFDYLNELKNIEQDIREISHDLNREKYVLVNNFIAISRNLFYDQQTSYPPNLLTTISEDIHWEQISNTVKINLYRIMQESLQNINKYAEAKNITVQLIKRGDNIILKIADDGVGFDIGIKKKGIGLQNIVSRTTECRGVFAIKSSKEKGTKITIILPIENKSRS